MLTSERPGEQKFGCLAASGGAHLTHSDPYPSTNRLNRMQWDLGFGRRGDRIAKMRLARSRTGTEIQ
jgi:hypothetical protein